MTLDKKQSQVIFLFEFKIFHGVVETTCDIKNTFGEELLTKMYSAVMVQICKGDKSLEDEKCSGRPLEFDNDQLTTITEADLFQRHEKLPRTTALTII